MKNSVTVIQEKKPTGSWLSMGKDDGKDNGSSVRCLKFSQKAIYVLVLFVLTLILLLQIFNCVSHFVEEPTYVETKVAPQHKALFPAMTICPQNNGYNEDNLKVFLFQCYCLASPPTTLY